jgi:trimethylamine:corrinoid methyltransferase-like protein
VQPRFQLLDDDLAERIIAEAKIVLAEVGVDINYEQMRSLLTDHGAGVDGAMSGIPAEIVPVPLTGFMAPVTLVGTLIQHTAEVLSGVVIAQLAQPATPLLFGGSPAIFDVRYETTPMGAVETTMLTCAAAEIGRRLGLPTQTN